MSQLTIYLPDTLEKAVREQAKREGQSLSAFLAGLARRAVQPSQWPDRISELHGSWEGSFPEMDDPPPDEVPSLGDTDRAIRVK